MHTYVGKDECRKRNKTKQSGRLRPNARPRIAANNQSRHTQTHGIKRKGNNVAKGNHASDHFSHALQPVWSCSRRHLERSATLRHIEDTLGTHDRDTLSRPPLYGAPAHCGPQQNKYAQHAPTDRWHRCENIPTVSAKVIVYTELTSDLTYAKRNTTCVCPGQF